MRRLAAVLLLLAGGCGGASEPAQRNEARPPADTPVPPEPAANTARPVEDPADPGTAGMSPSQRRAYERGYRDCRAGRYEPDPHSEAYRIGCAAAQE